MNDNHNDNTNKHRDHNASSVLKEATGSYFDMLNHSLSKFNKHKESNEKELKNGPRITSHRISL